MRIAWLSPVPPQPSGISEYSVSIVKELSNYAEVELWTDMDNPPKYLEGIKVVSYKADESYARRLREDYDAVVYNPGNTYLFHSQMYELMSEAPGITILHDYVMWDFFAGYFLEYKNSLREYSSFLRAYYPERWKELLNKVLSDEEKLKHPLSEPIIYRSAGVVVHSNFVKGMVQKVATCPVRTLYHPVLSADIEEVDKPYLRDGRFKVLIAGEITKNKKVYDVIREIGESKYLSYIRKLARVIVVGGGPDTERVRKLIATKGLGDFVVLEGRKPEKELNYYINKADLCVNLRYPTFGESSGVLIRALQMAKPVVVANVGFYAELPDDAVFKIDPRRLNTLPELIYNLMENPDRLKRVGERAKRYVYEHHSMERFIYGLLSFITEVRGFKPIHDTAAEVRQILSEFMSCPTFRYERELIGKVSQVFEDIS